MFVNDDNENSRADNLDFVIEMKTNRRRKLQSLISLSLSEHVLRSLSIFEDRILDQQLFAAMIALKRHNISISLSLRFNQDDDTIYNYRDLTLRILNSL